MEFPLSIKSWMHYVTIEAIATVSPVSSWIKKMGLDLHHLWELFRRIYVGKITDCIYDFAKILQSQGLIK